MEPLNRLLRCRLWRIGHGDPADALAIERDEQDRPARLPAQLVGDRRAAFRDHLTVPDNDGMPVDFRFDAMSPLLNDIGRNWFRAIRIFRASICLDNRFRYRVGRHGFRRSGESEDVNVSVPAARVDSRNGERAARQRPCLIHRDRIERGEPLEVVTSLDEDAVRAGGAESAEERQRDGYNEGARARYDEERQPAENPFRQGSESEDGRKDCDSQRRVTYNRGVYSREPRDERLRAGFPVRSLLDHLHDSRGGRRPELVRRPNPNHAI